MIDWILKRIPILIIGIFVFFNVFLLYNGKPLIIGVGLSALLFLVYLAFFHLDKLFWLTIFSAPLSIGIENYSKIGIGISLPTEPLLLGVLGMIFIRSIYNKPNFNLLNHPISLSILFYLFIVLITSISSSNPTVSFKFLLAKFWLIIPVFYFGSKMFSDVKNIFYFLKVFLISFSIVITYTLIRHAGKGFGEDPAHWVMSPFFKDHTSYGAILAMFIPPIIALIVNSRNNLKLRLLYISLLLFYLIALYFSYTRAAWLSIFFGIGVFLLMYFRVKMKLILSFILIAGSVVLLNWNEIQYQLSKNKAEHTTEDIGERLESMSNISTDASNLERLNRWNCAIEMFKERPLLGWGPGTYMFEYAAFQRSEDLTIISTSFSDGGNAHSEYLSALSESGVLGLFAFLLTVGMIFYKGIKLYSEIENSDLKVLLGSIIVGLCTYFLHGILNNYLDTDKASIPVWGFTAIIVAIDLYHRKSNKPTAK